MVHPAARPTDKDRQRINIKTMNTKQSMVGLMMAGIAAVATGCAEPRTEYVPAYSAPPGYAYPAPPAVPPQPGAVSGDTNLPPGTVYELQAGATLVAPTAPPAPQVEVVPVAPGPAYYWVPGYWGWNGTVWVWVSGAWRPRPWLGAVWVGGHWARRGHGYIWVGGHWR